MSSPSSAPVAELPVSPAPAATGAETDIQIDLPGRSAVRARIYGRRERGASVPLVLHFHGGTFVCGDLDNGRSVGRLLAAAGALVVSLDYPLAPQAPFPEPIEVGFAALEWLHRQRVKLGGKASRLFLAGEEAGGNLAAAVALMARDRAHPPLAGQILLSPMLDPCAGTASLRQATGDAIQCKWSAGWQEYLKRPRDAIHPYAVPGGSLRLAEIAPTLVLVGRDDPMRDEAMGFARRLGDAGIPVTSHMLPSAANWPEALYSPEGSGCAACEAVVRGHFRDFLNAAMRPAG